MKINQNVNGKTIYLTEYLRIWNFLKEKIFSNLKNFDYQEIFSEEEICLNDLLLLKQKIVFFKAMDMEVFAKYQSELEARTEALSLLSNYAHLMKKHSNLQIIDGYRDFKENIFCSGLFSLEDRFIIGLEVKIFLYENYWCVLGEYHHQIVEVINDYSVKYKLINNDLNPYKFALIALEDKDTESLALKKFLIEKYQAYHLEQNLPAKEKFNILEKMGCSYIFEIRKKGKLRIKIVHNGDEKDLFKEEIDSFLLENDQLINQSLVKINLINTINDLKQNTIYVCCDCSGELKEGKYLKIFNQRVKNNKCCKCDKAANYVFVKIF